jgi:subtilisin-like proprotein convertase family protein
VKKFNLIAALILFPFINLLAQDSTFVGDLGPGGLGTIPDDQGAVGATFACEVDNLGTLDELEFVSVLIDITHEYISDISVTLISPNGTELVLTSGLGDDGDDYTQTVFNQTASLPITSGEPPFTGEWRTLNPSDGLKVFDGEEADGTWSLFVTDDSPILYGNVNEWSLTFNSSISQQLPIADFSFFAQGLNVLFTNETELVVTDYAWDFGDGNTSTDKNASHEYASGGSYEVSLIASNNNGSDTATKTIEVMGPASVSNIQSQLKLYPNPAQSTIQFKTTEEIQLVILKDVTGKTVLKTQLNSSKTVDISMLTNGIYLVEALGLDNQTFITTLAVSK